MVRKSFMLLAGETSGDLLGAELVPILRDRLTDIQGLPTRDQQPLHASLPPKFFGAGGPHMAAAGVELAVDLAQHAVVGLWEVVKRYRHFRRLFVDLFQLAITRQPEAIICIDFSGFNLRFAHAIRHYVQARQGTFANWNPRLIQYVSPQVWASRPARAQRLARDFNLLLSIFPFEKAWYARRTPRLLVEFVGHPVVDRHAPNPALSVAAGSGAQSEASPTHVPTVVLLPGSRVGELQHHLPVLLEALTRIRAAQPSLRAWLVLPNDSLLRLARTFPLPPDLRVEAGSVVGALSQADLAIASTGTVTLECACFGVPTVALYKTSPITFWIAKRVAKVKFLAMPNLLADEQIFPEFIQDAATPENLARAALELLGSPDRRDAVRAKLRQAMQSLGPPGASARAASAILSLLQTEPRPIRASLGP